MSPKYKLHPPIHLSLRSIELGPPTFSDSCQPSPTRIVDVVAALQARDTYNMEEGLTSDWLHVERHPPPLRRKTEGKRGGEAVECINGSGS